MKPVTGTALYESKKYDNLRDLMMSACEMHGARDAFIFRRNPQQSEIHRSFHEFGEDIKAFGTYLLNSEFAGDKLAVVGENSYEWFVSYNAILSTDSVGVPLDRALPEDELVALLKRSESKILIYHHKHHKMMLNIAKRQDNGEDDIVVRKFIVMYREGVKDTDWPDDDRFASFYDLLEEGKEKINNGDNKFLTTPINAEEARIILFTSGTTSMSKGVLLSHKNITSNVHSINQTLDVHPGERAFSILPLHHTFENTCDFFILLSGGCLCLSDGLRYITKNLQEWGPNVCISVPILFENIYSKIEDVLVKTGKDKVVNVMRPITRFLKKCGIDKKYIDAFTDFGIDMYMGYGLTETSPVISVTNELLNVKGSVGRPMAGITAAIDCDGVGPKAVGEILTKSDSVMLGYYRNEEATKEAIDSDGWFHTGDMGYIDKTGSIHITGRVKSMIVLTNGKKAFPEEIESVIAEIKGVNEVFVWGNVNDKEAIDICAKILINRGDIGRELGLTVEPDDNQVEAYLNDKMHEANHTMPAYKIVRNYVFSEEDMIKTTTLKIKRPKEQEHIENKLKECGVTMRDVNGKNFDKLIKTS